MISMIREGFEFYKKNDLKTCWKAFIKRDTHPFLQFVKYGMCGVLAVIVHSVTFALISYDVWPAHKGLKIDGVVISMDLLIRNFVICNVIGFLTSNVAAYLTNLWFVFEGGRHHRVLEFLMFTAVASIGLIAGLVTGIAALKSGVASSWISTFILIITAALVNFACRKFFIFKG